MELKTLDEIYELTAYNDYKTSMIEHCFVYVQDIDQYALVSHGGILFDDYKFIENIDISDTDIEDLDVLIQFVAKNLGPVVKIVGQQPKIKTKETKLNRGREEILASNEYFKSYKRTQAKKLFWSEKLDKYYLVTEKGVMFDDGVFYSRQECLKLQANLPCDKSLKAIHAAKSVFGWDQIKLLD